VAHGAPAPGRRPPGSLARRRCSARPLPGSLQPARSAQLTALAARPTQLVEIHRHARLAALHPLDHRLVARLSLEADRHGPSFKHVLQRSKVLGLGGHCQRLGDLLDEPLLVSGDAPGAAARSGRRRSVRPRSCPRLRRACAMPMAAVCRTYDQASSFDAAPACPAMQPRPLPCKENTTG
jgi:hypothetical protein